MVMVASKKRRLKRVILKLSMVPITETLLTTIKLRSSHMKK